MHTLYVVRSSHPCDTVKKALELEAIRYRPVELLIPAHARAADAALRHASCLR